MIHSCHKPINPKDLKTFNKIFKEYYNELCYFGNKIINNSDDIKDIVSDSFCKFYESCRTFENIDHVRAFLYKITKNKCLNYIRHENYKKEYIFFAKNAPHFFIDDAFEVKEIYYHLKYLSPHKRKVFKLRYIDGYNRYEIADLLNISPNTARNHYVSSLSYLKKRIEQERGN